MLRRLDREAQRLYQGDKLWYTNKKRETDEIEIQRIRRNIKILYVICLIGSITTVFYLVVKYLRITNVI